MSLPPFHLAFPVRDLVETRRFYVEVLGCGIGRQSDSWIDLDLFGHQIVAHLKPETCSSGATNPVDGDPVPVPHFGAVLSWKEWEKLGRRLESMKIPFVIQPRVRFKGQVGEQGTFFILDPSGNALEFKSFKDSGRLFAQDV